MTKTPLLTTAILGLALAFAGGATLAKGPPQTQADDVGRAGDLRAGVHARRWLT